MRNFVMCYLASGGEKSSFVTDKQVTNDESIEAWYTELQNSTGGRLKTFSVIEAVEQIVNAVTMCIYIATLLNKAINPPPVTRPLEWLIASYILIILSMKPAED